MYHVALAVQSDDDHLGSKLDAVTALPDATGAVTVTVVHVHDDDREVAAVPSVREALDRLEVADVETTVRGVLADDPPDGLLEAAETLDVDAICIGGRRRSPAGKLQLKPGAQEVLLRGKVPVLVAGDLESRAPRV